MEGLELNRHFWCQRRVLITGHTGFKGSWLTQWLKLAGANITGYALEPPTEPSLFRATAVGDGIESIVGDVRDLEGLRRAVSAARPEIVIHMAAQSLVRPSYENPVGTFETNVMGTVNLLESLRGAAGLHVVVIVTSDKCYDNREWVWPYREHDPMGGRDPYASSKGCAELVTAAYRSSFFAHEGAPRIVSVRAGNVIGGGDWARDRLVPDLLRAFGEGRQAAIRNPSATRPWLFVLDTLNGYLQVAEALFADGDLPVAWNFGPASEDVRPVRWVAEWMVRAWGEGAGWRSEAADHPHESLSLKLDSSRARALLGWKPVLDVSTAIAWTIDWYKTWLREPVRAAEITRQQIERFESLDDSRLRA